jgi:hypothetical protein
VSGASNADVGDRHPHGGTLVDKEWRWVIEDRHSTANAGLDPAIHRL